MFIAERHDQVLAKRYRQ